MTEADSQTTDPSVQSVSISDLIAGRIFAAASLTVAPKCALAGRIWPVVGEKVPGVTSSTNNSEVCSSGQTDRHQ
jgi:hypothetical protein